MSEAKSNGVLLMVLGTAVLALGGVGFASWFQSKQKAEAFAESRNNECFNQVKRNFRYPSKAVLLSTVEVSPTELAGRAEFMNGFGAMIPYRFQCEFYSDTSDTVKGRPRITEGD